MKVKVLRLGHRLKRDPRLSTHVSLIARALGADEVILSGEQDDAILKTVNSVTQRWGGPFKITYEKNWDKVLAREKKKSEIIHLTMYGLPFEKLLPKIRKNRKPKLIVVGSEKVPGRVYGIADYNLAVTNQPHSEAGALAVFLHALFKGKSKKFKNALTKIIPVERGKKVIKTS